MQGFKFPKYTFNIRRDQPPTKWFNVAIIENATTYPFMRSFGYQLTLWRPLAVKTLPHLGGTTCHVATRLHSRWRPTNP